MLWVMEPTLTKIKAGWSAKGAGWAVHGPTREEALKRYREAEALHRVIMERDEKAAIREN